MNQSGEQKIDATAGQRAQIAILNGSRWALVNKRERWGLTWFGWAAILFLFCAMCLWFVHSAYSFLAVTDKVETRLLVVEGWIPQYAVRASAEEFQNGYRLAVVTGGPITGMGGYTNDYNTSASVGAARLRTAGVAPDKVQMAPSRVSGRDRTFASAVALRNWFVEHQITDRSFNLITESAHARRSQLLFKKAFGGDFRIGVIAVPNPDYDPARWWRFSEGVRDVTSEAIAFVYARCFFYYLVTDSTNGAPIAEDKTSH